MKKLIFLLMFLCPLFVFAQQPKMHIKLYGGWNSSNLVYRIENIDPDLLTGWQVGGSFRITHRKEFLEIGLTYVNAGITIAPNEDADIIVEEPIDIRTHSMELPLTIGYLPIKTPLYKWYVYGGLVNRFSMKGKYTYQGETGTFKPSELRLHWYNLGARFGTQIDIAFFNFDFNYTIGITNAFKQKARTNTHGLQLSVGLLF